MWNFKNALYRYRRASFPAIIITSFIATGQLNVVLACNLLQYYWFSNFAYPETRVTSKIYAHEQLNIDTFIQIRPSGRQSRYGSLNLICPRYKKRN